MPNSESSRKFFQVVVTGPLRPDFEPKDTFFFLMVRYRFVPASIATWTIWKAKISGLLVAGSRSGQLEKVLRLGLASIQPMGSGSEKSRSNFSIISKENRLP